MGVRWKHFKTVMKHKAVVYRECKACGIMRQGIIHDLSKFSFVEFASSAKYFQGTGSPIEKEKLKKDIPKLGFIIKDTINIIGNGGLTSGKMEKSLQTRFLPIMLSRWSVTG